MSRERRRLALQSTAVAQLKAIVRVADATLVEYLRAVPADKEPDLMPGNMPADPHLPPAREEASGE